MRSCGRVAGIEREVIELSGSLRVWSGSREEALVCERDRGVAHLMSHNMILASKPAVTSTWASALNATQLILP